MKLRIANSGLRICRRASAPLDSFRTPHSALCNGRRAFTLIEVMVAMTIFCLVVAAIYSSWDLIWRASRVSQAAAARVQRQRVAIHTIEDALTCVQSFQASMQYYSFLVNDDPPELEFTSRVPDNFPRNGKFGDLNVRRLVFSVEPGPDTDRQEKVLVLRQKPLLLDMDEDEQKNPLVLARYVEGFKVQCWDTNQAAWVSEWDDTNAIPPLIRVELSLGNNNPDSGRNIPPLDVSRVIAVPSQTMPAIVQQGNAAAGGPPGINFGNPAQTGRGAPGAAGGPGGPGAGGNSPQTSPYNFKRGR